MQVVWPVRAVPVLGFAGHGIQRAALPSSGAPSSGASGGAAGLDTVAGTPAQFAASIKSDIARWAKVIKDNRIEPQ